MSANETKGRLQAELLELLSIIETRMTYAFGHVSFY